MHNDGPTSLPNPIGLDWLASRAKESFFGFGANSDNKSQRMHNTHHLKLSHSIVLIL